MRSAAQLIVTISVASGFITASRLPVRIYTTADGLANNRINKIVRDSRGYLWFCTQEGLSRFDGYSFSNYGPPEGLPPRPITDLLETRTGEYWVATLGGGLVRFDPESADHKFRSFLPDDGEASNRISTVLEDHAGHIWCGTFNGLYRFERTGKGDSRTPAESRFRRVEIGTPAGGLDLARVNVLLEDRQGALWLGAESGLYRLLPSGASERFTTVNGLPNNRVKTLLQDHLEQLWAGTMGGLCRITSDRPGEHGIVERVYTAADGLATEQVWSLLDSSNGKLWVGAFEGLSELLPGPSETSKILKRYTIANGLSGLEISSLTEDLNHNLWIGSDDGAVKVTQSNFTTFTAEDGMNPAAYGSTSVRVTSIFQDRVGTLCVTSAGDRRKPFLSRLEGEQFKSVFPDLPTDVESIGWGTHQTALQDRFGDWWIATTKGLARFAAPARFEQLAQAPLKAWYTVIDGLSPGEVFRIFEDSRGDVWVATWPNGLTRWDRRTASFRRDAGARDPIFGEFVSAFAEDRASDLWIGLFNGGLVRFRKGQFVRFGESNGLGSGGVRDIYCDRAGRLWVATSRGGVTRIDSPEKDQPSFANISVSQGLASAQAECITEDRWGRIYVCGGRGIDRLDSAAPNGVSRHFTTADGLAGGNFEAAFADRDGNLWFGTSQGLSRLAPKPEPRQSTPRTLISALRIRGVRYPLSDLGVDHLSGIQLKPDQSQMEVSFVGLSFEAGDVLRYQFMLVGADRDWSPPTLQRTVNYASLKPGSYTFLVRAVNSAGISGTSPASLAFTLLPPLWQRWWFLTVCACGVMGVAYALHRNRLARVVQLERVRTRIATDLHDDIGASLSQIAVVSEVLSQRGGAEDRFREPLSKIAADSRELVASMSDLVWSIDPRRDHLHDLAQRMRRFSSDMFTARNIQFQFSAPAGDLLLTVDQRRQIFLIFKEGVNNIIRHSACTTAEVGLAFEANTLVLRLRDNGHGLDLSQARYGNGLSDMRARAAALGGEVEISDGPDCGTDVTLKIPLRRLPLSRWRAFFHLNRG